MEIGEQCWNDCYGEPATRQDMGIVDFTDVSERFHTKYVVKTFKHYM